MILTEAAEARAFGSRRGFTLLEVVIAVACTLLIAQLTIRSFAGARSLLSKQLERVERIQAERSARLILRRELSAGSPDQDWQLYPPDSLRLRAFRGAGRVCPSAADSVLVVLWAGHRRPDPTKDSVLVLRAGGRWETHDLLAASRRGPRCPLAPEDTTDTWTLSAALSDAVFVRLFESGSYHVGDEALRYRRGAGGRQPLTHPALGDARLEWSGGSVALSLLDPSRRGPRRVEFLAPGRRP